MYKRFEAKLYSATGLAVRTLSPNSLLFFISSFELQAKRGNKKMENNNEWLKRKRRYWISNSVVLKILKRLYYRLEELIWLGIGVWILVVVVNLFCI